MKKVICKENIIRSFDKANGFGEEFGDWADYAEITQIRDEFIRLVDGLFEIEAKQIFSFISKRALINVDKEI